jgi:2-oxoacid:acceptor oxidoreductase delta subunit (pyruvate/2-ketoisovalerate family)
VSQDKSIIKGFVLMDTTTRGGQYVGNWRVLMPEIDEVKCVACGLCATICPEAAITGKPKVKPKIDMRFCKGCGVCANECPQKAIEMKQEAKK